MPFVNSDDRSFSFEYEPGVTCTYWRYAPTIYIYDCNSPYFKENDDGTNGFINIIMAEHLSYLKSIDEDLNSDLIFAPNYVFHYKPGLWDKETLLSILEQAVENEEYEKAQLIKNELNERYGAN